ncbi:MAG: hypothetical protein C5B59_14375 [Bacteroidetes bacterium]|nr:MAG: hypothetical protein C5B59_14375 [Bacteroidota bacterium]
MSNEQSTQASELINRLSQYADFSASFFDDFPNNLPRKLPLKLGERVIGWLMMDWKAVIGKLFDSYAESIKPANLTEEEYTQQLKDYFQSLGAEDTKEIMSCFHSQMWHILEFLPEKLHDAMIDLAVEGRQKQVIRSQQKLGAEIPSPAKFAMELADLEREAIKRRLPKLKPSRTKSQWKSEDNLRRFAEKVGARRLLFQCMKNMYEQCCFDAGWVEDLKQDELFKILSRNVPKHSITWAVRHIGDENLSAREKEPVSMACEMARQELDLPEQDVPTLRNYYQRGIKLLREKRTN